MKPYFVWRGAVLASDLPPTTRFVLLTLGCHMNDAGESCFPSIETIAKESGLSISAVTRNLGFAKASGWIICEKHGYKNSKWSRNDYKISFPSEMVCLTDPETEMVVAQSYVDSEMVVAQSSTSTSLKTNSPVVTNVTTCVPSKSSPTNVIDENRISFDVKSGQFRGFAENQLELWEKLFKKIDVVAEMEKAEAWLVVNPRKRKKNYGRFLHNWFSRAMDRLTQRPAPFKPQHAATRH